MPDSDLFTIHEVGQTYGIKTAPEGTDRLEIQEEGSTGSSKEVSLTNLSKGLGLADGTNQGAMSSADKTKLDGVAAGAIANVVEDTSPQLGGNLDVNGKEITGSIDLHSDDNVVLELGDDAGANDVSVRDSGGVEVFAVDSNGNVTMLGTTDGRDVAADGTKLDTIETNADVTDAANVDAAGAVMESDYDANSVLIATSDNTPVAYSFPANTILGRVGSGAPSGILIPLSSVMYRTTGDITTGVINNGEFFGRPLGSVLGPVTKAQALAMLNVEDGADVTDATNVNAAGAVMESDYDAQTVLAAVTDNTPAAQTIGDGEFVGRPIGGNVGNVTKAQAQAMVDVVLTHGQCIFKYISATECRLTRQGGPGGIYINGTMEQVPSGGTGVSFTNGSLSASTFYYAYVYMSGSTMTAEWSTTGPAINQTTGVWTKSGDNTRTLIGCAYTNSSSQFDFSASKRNVRSVFNEPEWASHLISGTSYNTTSTSLTEVNTALRVQIASWGAEQHKTLMSAQLWNGTAANTVALVGARDGTTYIGAQKSSHSPSSGYIYPHTHHVPDTPGAGMTEYSPAWTVSGGTGNGNQWVVEVHMDAGHVL